MKWVSADEALFSIKCYLSAMLALYLAYAIGLPRPFWSMMTAYVVVTQPWVGSVRSKALYRLGGTFLGSAAAVFMVPQLINAPILLSAAMALWVGGCLYLSLLDRTPRSYVFMLAGYTAALVGFPGVADPGNIFNTAVARVEEIGLGIICATVVHSVIFPRGIGAVVLARLDKTGADARAWIQDVLKGTDVGTRDKDQRTLANDITQLRLLSTHVPFDPGNIRWTAPALRVVQERIVALTPCVSAVEDRLRALHDCGHELPTAVKDILRDVSEWIAAGADAAPSQATQLRGSIERLSPVMHPDSEWTDMLMMSLTARIRELVDTYAECLILRKDIEDGLQGISKRPRRRDEAAAGLHRDPGLALLSAFAAAIAIFVCCAFWILTAWTGGSAAVMMAAVFCCFFATMDNPVPMIRQFLIYTALSMPLSALYLLGIMPALHSFEMLALAIFPAVFFLSALTLRPAMALKAAALLFGVLGSLALQDTNSLNLVSFIDSMLGQLAGTAVAAIVTAIFRTISADRAARRIQAANWRDLATLAVAAHKPDARAYTSRMLDRIGLLQPRLALATRRDDLVATDALLDLRIGNDIAGLQRARRHLPIADGAILPMLHSLAQRFGGRLPNKAEDHASPLLSQLDGALSNVANGPAVAASNRAIVALVGIRRGLFPTASDYQPRLAPAEVQAI